MDSGTTFERTESEGDDDAEETEETLNNPLSSFSLRFHRWMHILRQSYLSILLLCISIQVFVLEVKFSSYTSMPWAVVFLPVWIATLVNTTATTYELRLSSTSRRTRRSHVIEHINHIIFWFALSIVSFLTCLKMSNVIQWGATAICVPLFVALVIQSILYPFKDTKRVHGCRIPEGFPADPVYVTSLFVALRIDEVIMWDWNWVVWCPWVIWIVALIDVIFYTVYFGFVLHRYIYFTEAEDSWGGTIIDGVQYFYNPLWHTIRIGVLWAMAAMLVATLFIVLWATAMRMNGDVTVKSIMITLPLGFMMLWSGITSLCITYVIKPRLLRREPAKCGICKKQIRQILRIEISQDGASKSRSGRTVKVIDYGEEDSRVQRVARNVLGILNAPHSAAPAQLWNPPGKSFFLPAEIQGELGNAQQDSYNSSNNDDENQRLLPSRGDKQDYHERANPLFGGRSPESDAVAVDDSIQYPATNHFKGFCPICMESVPIDCVFLDCGHNIYCWNCGVDIFARRVEK